MLSVVGPRPDPAREMWRTTRWSFRLGIHPLEDWSISGRATYELPTSYVRATYELGTSGPEGAEEGLAFDRQRQTSRIDAGDGIVRLVLRLSLFRLG